jgi:hypothetical protein
LTGRSAIRLLGYAWANADRSARASALAAPYGNRVIEITVRDGRATRDRSQDTEEGGAILGTLQRDEPYEIGDAISLPDGSAAMVIGERERLQPGQNWQQTVLVGERRQPRHITIDVGGCPEWTLQSAGATTTFVRCVSTDEVEQIKTVAAYCRKYVTLPTYRLLSSSFRVWKQTLDQVVNAPREEWTPALADALQAAAVGWLLIWRLVLDQAAHDLSSRFGKDSDQLNKFRAATHRAYDNSRAYRIVEALRNLVQHQEMPSLILRRTQELDSATGQRASKVTYRFPVSDLLNSSICPATIKNEFRDQPDTEFDLPAIIDEAMAGMNTVLVELAGSSVPELIGHVTMLRRIFRESSGTPMLLRIAPQAASAGSKITGSNIEMAPLHDLQLLVQTAPIPDNPSEQQTETSA